ncbi:MAG TPA: biotin/lipoate A/B protein ligase family protein [Anaerolineaceae bacterium]|nr:biotin/lipoate A/B protein ligase family protein [Anaerolineaceae bacterium]
MTRWRLLLSAPASGSTNMALDEAILWSAAQKLTPPTLRLYDWHPATLSLGFAQPYLDTDMEALKRENWSLVRRPTGGRAIMHVDELTYAVAAPVDDPLLSGSLLESYRKISCALLAGLSVLQVKAVGDKTYDNGVTGQVVNPVCFETPSNYEITVNGKKLIGSAQARKHGGLLQHGSLPIKGDITRITRVLKYTTPAERREAAGKLALRATTLEEILRHAPDWRIVADGIITGFREFFNLDLVPGETTHDELQMADELARNKYASPEWTFRI